MTDREEIQLSVSAQDPSRFCSLSEKGVRKGCWVGAIFMRSTCDPRAVHWGVGRSRRLLQACPSALYTSLVAPLVPLRGWFRLLAVPRQLCFLVFGVWTDGASFFPRPSSSCISCRVAENAGDNSIGSWSKNEPDEFIDKPHTCGYECGFYIDLFYVLRQLQYYYI